MASMWYNGLLLELFDHVMVSLSALQVFVTFGYISNGQIYISRYILF